MYLEFNDLAVTNMPDGMPHIKVPSKYIGSSSVTINASLVSTEDLLVMGMLIETLKRNGTIDIRLQIHYLIGQRMDRPISECEPNTLRSVCDFLNNLNVNIRVVFPHSQSTIDRLQEWGDHCCQNTYNECNFIEDGVSWLSKLGPNLGIVLPDAGAEKRFWNDHVGVLKNLEEKHSIKVDRVVGATKHRDMKTGKLSGFGVNDDTVPKTCIIVDDLCDGGFTFVGLAELLRKKGAKKVGLCVYHGIFSKGLPLKGIDAIYTTNSFKGFDNTSYIHCKKVV